MPVAIGALAVFSGCSGHTTGASDITLQRDGTYSAKLNAVGSCEHGSPSTPCTAYIRWRKVGTSRWTKGALVTVPKTVSGVHRFQAATGLAPNTTYEYQVCGNEFGYKTFRCAGPSGLASTDKFATGGGSTGGGGTTTHSGAQAPGATKPQLKNGQHATSPPRSGSGTQSGGRGRTNGSSPVSLDDGGGGGTSPLVPIAIGVAAGILVVGGAWLAGRRFWW